MFVKVRDFMYHNPRARIEEICEGTGATKDMVMDWLREGRLMTDENSTPLLTCSKCGAPIATGKLCGRCANDFVSQVSSASDEMTSAIRRQTDVGERRGLNYDHK